MNSRLPFIKFSATGNDFILFDNRDGRVQETAPAFIRALCARRTGVGADGVLLVETSERAHFRLRYFNADGHEAAMCGNGARAAAFYAFHHGIAPIHSTFEVGNTLYEAIVEGKAVSLLLHPPTGVQHNLGIVEEAGLQELGYGELGVPHYVLLCEDAARVDVDQSGKKYCNHPHFQPKRTNVNFVSRHLGGGLVIRTYERGVDAETLSCGTGAVVSAVLAHQVLQLAFPIELHTRGGTLTVSLDTTSGRPLLHGEIAIPFTGEFHREGLRFESTALS